jgi:hypothetical protein
MYRIEKILFRKYVLGYFELYDAFLLFCFKPNAAMADCLRTAVTRTQDSREAETTDVT